MVYQCPSCEREIEWYDVYASEENRYWVGENAVKGAMNWELCGVEDFTGTLYRVECPYCGKAETFNDEEDVEEYILATLVEE